MSHLAEPSVKALVILGQGGNRIYSTYYDEELRKHEKELEKKLYVKASGIQAPVDAEIMLLDNVISVFRTGQVCLSAYFSSSSPSLWEFGDT